mmetsp:Transcript_20446/g.25163  ORF Transcript_20446/g.25163 Transcript_20446/m.25163 type:complete len:518 (-) Transcript_20446:191-1744(-)
MTSQIITTSSTSSLSTPVAFNFYHSSYSTISKSTSILPRSPLVPYYTNHHHHPSESIHRQNRHLILSNPLIRRKRRQRRRVKTNMQLSYSDNDNNDDEPNLSEDEQQQQRVPRNKCGDVLLGDLEDLDIHNDDDDDHPGEFIDFDDQDYLLEDLLALSDDLHTNSYHLDDELEELEKLIDEQGWTNETEFNQNIQQLLGQKTSGRDDTDNNIDDVKKTSHTSSSSSPSALEKALLQGVVPASAGVGSKCLPGDFGFDPLGLSKKNYFKQAQNFLLGFLPSNSKNNDFGAGYDSGAALPLSTKPKVPLYNDSNRPPALILRDYREAEIRHGRLAMLAAILWPLQEIMDRLLIPNSFGKTTFVYGGATLPFISLFMTLVMLLLGYLDIYAAAIKDNESGDAFLPGECFWDPLKMLDGAPDLMKKNMQERELNNGRIAMMTVLMYFIQEAVTYQPLISLPWNQILFEPAFEIPEVQAWLDSQFAGTIVDRIDSESIDVPSEYIETWKEILLEEGSDINGI